jgi:hypothetical protein
MRQTTCSAKRNDQPIEKAKTAPQNQYTSRTPLYRQFLATKKTNKTENARLLPTVLPLKVTFGAKPSKPHKLIQRTKGRFKLN